MLETYQLVKIALSIGMVVGLSLIAERSGPRAAGILAGYPLGITQAGLIGNLCLTAGYLLGQRLPGRWGLLAGSVFGVAAFLLAGSMLQWVPGLLSVQLALTALAIALSSFAYRRLPEQAVQRRGEPPGPGSAPGISRTQPR